MLESFLITFREGLEAFLLVGILMSYLDKIQASAYKRYLYYGVAAGVLASLVAAIVLQVVISQFESEFYNRALMILILLFAAGVLSYMAIWMQRQARAHTASVQQQLERHVGAGNLLGMVSLAFVAVLREGVETVLFFSALQAANDDALTLRAGLTGGTLGLAGSLLLVYALVSRTRQVPLGPFFKWSGLLLVIIAGGLLSSGVSQMQAIGWVPIWVPKLFDINWILDDTAGVGIFLRALFGYNASPALLPFLAWTLYLGVFVSLWRRAYASPA